MTGSGSAGTPRGRLLVISGPSGVGKGTVVAELSRRRGDVATSVSATTRPPRPGEVDGRDYHFLSEEEFGRRVDRGEFLEWAEFNGHRYGTPRDAVASALAAGQTVVLEIDVQGAAQVRHRHPEAVLVFLEAPSERVLAERLRRRGADDPATIARRLAIARQELAEAASFDHVVVNDRLSEAVDAVGRILDGMAGVD